MNLFMNENIIQKGYFSIVLGKKLSMAATLVFLVKFIILVLIVLIMLNTFNAFIVTKI
jgi:hypothetical protein